MSFLLDTNVLLWVASNPQRIPSKIMAELLDLDTPNYFSVISIWEVAIKSALNKPDFQYDAVQLRLGLLTNRWEELNFTGDHAAAVTTLPMLHRDPFDRALIAQAISEGLTLITSDEKMGAYGAMVRVV